MPSEKKCIKCGEHLSGVSPGKQPVGDGGWQHTKCPKPVTRIATLHT
jgi:hypothetical protein